MVAPTLCQWQAAAGVAEFPVTQTTSSFVFTCKIKEFPTDTIYP